MPAHLCAGWRVLPSWLRPFRRGRTNGSDSATPRAISRSPPPSPARPRRVPRRPSSCSTDAAGSSAMGVRRPSLATGGMPSSRRASPSGWSIARPRAVSARHAARRSPPTPVGRTTVGRRRGPRLPAGPRIRRSRPHQPRGLIPGRRRRAPRRRPRAADGPIHRPPTRSRARSRSTPALAARPCSPVPSSTQLREGGPPTSRTSSSWRDRQRDACRALRSLSARRARPWRSGHGPDRRGCGAWLQCIGQPDARHRRLPTGQLGAARRNQRGGPGRRLRARPRLPSGAAPARGDPVIAGGRRPRAGAAFRWPRP